MHGAGNDGAGEHHADEDGAENRGGKQESHSPHDDTPLRDAHCSKNRKPIYEFLRSRGLRWITKTIRTCTVHPLLALLRPIVCVPITAGEGSVMLYDRTLLGEVAERIAATENRQSQLRVRIARLRDEGSDPTREEEVLGLLAQSLAQLYRTQATMRRTSWTVNSAA